MPKTVVSRRLSLLPTRNTLCLLEKERRLQEVYDHADLVIPDGISLLIAARLYGRSLQQRIAGVDIFKALCGLAAEADLQVFLLGGRPGSAELAAAVLKAEYPNLKCTTYCPPLGFEQSADGLKRDRRRDHRRAAQHPVCGPGSTQTGVLDL